MIKIYNRAGKNFKDHQEYAAKVIETNLVARNVLRRWKKEKQTESQDDKGDIVSNVGNAKSCAERKEKIQDGANTKTRK